MLRTFIRNFTFRQRYGTNLTRSDSHQRSQRQRRDLRLEPLEQRVLLSASSASEFALGEVSQVPAYLPYGRSDWYEPHVSDDGRFVAFATPASLVSEDTNRLDDVYVVDLQTNALTWASRTYDGTKATGGSWKPEISPDGRYVAFMSLANNLVPGDQDPSYDLFVFDRVTEAIECITADQDGDALAPRFSGDNQRIVYEFEFNDTLPTNPNARTKDIVLLDLATGERRVVTTGFDGETGNSISWRPHISHDGQFVVFQSQSSNLVANDVGNTWDVFLYEVAADTLECLSVNADGNPANGESTSIRSRACGRQTQPFCLAAVPPLPPRARRSSVSFHHLIRYSVAFPAVAAREPPNRARSRDRIWTPNPTSRTGATAPVPVPLPGRRPTSPCCPRAEGPPACQGSYRLPG